MLVTTQVYVPAKALVTLGTIKTPRTIGTDTPFGLKISNVVISGMFLVTQVICNKSPSLTVALENNGCCKTKRKMLS